MLSWTHRIRWTNGLGVEHSQRVVQTKDGDFLNIHADKLRVVGNNLHEVCHLSGDTVRIARAVTVEEL